jgi:L-threonylcarbamoyladenylate synthase
VEAVTVGDGEAERAVAALRAGRPVVLPTDTVYGLCALPYRPEPVRAAYRVKGREETQPSALVAADVDLLFECIPELRSRVGGMLRTLLPGPLTLVVPNPARRFRWLTGATPDAIGVRVPELPGVAASIIATVGAVLATSANLPGRPDPRRLEDVPPEIRDRCGCVIDGGELPGVPSTVIDLTGDEPRLLREGAAPAADVLGRIASLAGE